MCHWNEDRSKFKGKGQRTSAKQAFTFYPSSAADGPRCHNLYCLKNSVAIFSLWSTAIICFIWHRHCIYILRLDPLEVATADHSSPLPLSSNNLYPPSQLTSIYLLLGLSLFLLATWQFHHQHLLHVNVYPTPFFVHVQTISASPPISLSLYYPTCDVPLRKYAHFLL